jgi:hypothetical protein
LTDTLGSILPADDIKTLKTLVDEIKRVAAIGVGAVRLGGKEISDLYVAGPGIFATSGASNPTYTIFALSLRGAESPRQTGRRSQVYVQYPAQTRTAAAQLLRRQGVGA